MKLNRAHLDHSIWRYVSSGGIARWRGGLPSPLGMKPTHHARASSGRKSRRC